MDGQDVEHPPGSTGVEVGMRAHHRGEQLHGAGSVGAGLLQNPAGIAAVDHGTHLLGKVLRDPVDPLPIVDHVLADETLVVE
jgi:hypothetical protein